MSTGWIKLSRNMADHWLWTGEFSRGQAWIDLLLHASHSDNQKMIIKGEVITWSRGQQIRSVKTLEQAWGWSRSKVNRFLDLLEKDGMIVRQGGHLTTVISICNYDIFQGSRTSDDTSGDISNGHLTDISRATNKNVNKEENEKKVTSRFTPPTLEEVISYCRERQNTVDANKFINHYEANGWMRGKNKIKDWKACVRTWEEKSNNYQPQPPNGPPQKQAMPKAGTEE